MDANRRNLYSVSFSQFGNALSNNFVKIFLPFYVLKISPYSPQQTLLWIGAIMGAPSLCAALTSTFWGSLTHRYSPKWLYLRTFLVNTIGCFLMGFTTNLSLLLILRILQGLMTGSSTIGLIIVSSTSPRERVSADIGFFQASLTCGQLVGPILGSLAAGAFGYKGAFISASSVLFLSVVFCFFYVTDIPKLPARDAASRSRTLDKRVMVSWMLCFTVMIQLMFLPSVLPAVFENFRIEEAIALKWAGVVVMLYTATAMVGTYLLSLCSRRVGIYRLIILLASAGILLQGLFVFSEGVVDFTIMRMIQTGLVAAIYPLTMSIFAKESKGNVIGFLNSARFAGNALGPMIATTLLAFSNLPTLYLFISLIGLSALLGFGHVFRHPPVEAGTH
jgi:MFS family permease